MLAGDASHSKLFAAAHSLHGLIDQGTLGEHDLALRRTYVVEVDINRQTWSVEDEQVERRAALERNAWTQEGVTADSVEQTEQMARLLEQVNGEAGCGRLALQIVDGVTHVTSAHSRRSTRAGTTRFQGWTSLPGSRRPSR